MMTHSLSLLVEGQLMISHTFPKPRAAQRPQRLSKGGAPIHTRFPTITMRKTRTLTRSMKPMSKTDRSQRNSKTLRVKKFLPRVLQVRNLESSRLVLLANLPYLTKKNKAPMKTVSIPTATNFPPSTPGARPPS